MYRLPHHSLTALLLLLSLFSCRKEGGEEVLNSDFSGKWAEVDENSYSSAYLDFFMGKCYDYACTGKHKIHDNKMYGCRNMTRTSVNIFDYHNDESNSITIGGQTLSFLRITENQIKIGDKLFTRFNTFVDDHYPSDRPSHIQFERSQYTLTLGKEHQLKFNVFPENALWTTARWTSDRNDIAMVNADGFIDAINVGTATITLTLDNFISTSCKVTVAADLSADEPANCYIVPRLGTWEFACLFKGSSYELLPMADSVAVLWESRGGTQDVSRGDIVDNISLSENHYRVRFTAGMNDGNALIGVFDSNKTLLWSWHIWVCKDYNPEDKAQSYLNSAGTMMDRNLGATSMDPDAPTCYGLLYQWGRKDPFPGHGSMDKDNPVQGKYTLGILPKTPVSATTGTIAYTTQHPTEFIVGNESSEFDWVFAERCDTLWSDVKTMYDPCPPGWRMPTGHGERINAGVWRKSLNSDEHWTNSSLGKYHCLNAIKIFSSSNCLIPSSGRIAPDGAYGSHVTRGYYWTHTQYKGHIPDYMFFIYNTGQYFNYGIYLNHKNWSNNEDYRSNAYSVRCQKK